MSRWAPGKKTPKSVGRAYVGFWFHCSPNPDNNVTVTINRALVEGLDAQMQAIRDGGSAVVLTPEQAGEILRALRTAENKQLRG
ncbi:hypothetical protein DN612_13075 [Aeromonas caviae]|nr:hypothetical protein DN612_13075 [Aeromonas caviae]